jgi:hypothetical protein
VSERAIDAYALVHAGSVAGDALLAIGLADSVFFSVSADQAKWRVAAYLLLTMAPLAVAAPVLSRVLDRGGFRRAVTFGAAVFRGLVAFLLASRTDTWLLFPLAFAGLVAARVHLVSKNALTAAYAERVGLVNENALLSRVAAISATLAAIPGVLAVRYGGTGAVVVLAGAAYAGCALLSLRLPAAPEPPRAHPDAEVPALSRMVRAVGDGMTGIRGGTGFLVLLIAFALRRVDGPAYWLGILVGALAVGTFVGAFIAPRIAHDGREERVMLGSLLLTGLGALIATVEFSLPTLALFVLLAGVASETARLGFQSLIQKEAGPGAEGRAYVKYEVRFQLAWVAGAFLPAMIPITFRPGLLVLAATYAGVAVWIKIRD